jgi:hypothetical protein
MTREIVVFDTPATSATSVIDGDRPRFVDELIGIVGLTTTDLARPEYGWQPARGWRGSGFGSRDQRRDPSAAGPRGAP